MPPSSDSFKMGRTEFVALMAMMMAAIAFSIDSILPALPTIAAELSPDAPQQAPLILSMFLLGLGVGTFFTGPLSDAYGRKPLILFASGLYILGAAVAWAAQSLEVILFARVLQGLGASGPRVVSIAIVRDRFAGRQMAQVVSIIMMIFTLVPAVAPLLGEFIIHLTGWRGIFLSFILFAVIICVWMSFRLPETLPVEDRRPMRLTLMFSAVKEMAKHQVVRLSIFVQTLIMGCLFLTLMLVQQVYDLVYARADEFPYWFFLVAILSGSAGLLNALLVVRFGMYRLVTLALAFQILFSGAFVLFDLGAGPYGFFFFVFWQTTIFFQAGMTLGNLNALAMEPMGHIAGMAASVIGALSTVGAVLISGPLGTMIHGDERLLAACVFVLAFVGCLTMLWMGRALKKQAVG